MNQQYLTLMGRTTAEPTRLEDKNGKDYYKFSVAVNEFNSKTKEKSASFFSVLCFLNSTKTVAKNLVKGDIVFVTGKPEVNAYESKDGELKAEMQVLANYLTGYSYKLPKPTTVTSVDEAKKLPSKKNS